MDDSRFDDLARALAISRRGALKHLVACVVSGVGGLLGVGVAAAQGCAPVRRRCAADADCCSGLCDQASGRCACGEGTEECGSDCIAIEQYQSDAENCGSCRVRCRQAEECQLPACLDGACGTAPDPALVGQPCGRDGGACSADGVCACPSERPTSCRGGCVDTTTDLDNCGACDSRCRSTSHGEAVCAGGVCGITCDAGYTSCGDGCCADDRDCCNGECCGPNDCCAAEGCVRCRCVIGIDSFDNGEINPANACQVCDPTRTTSDWTIRSDGVFCGEGRVCCNGDCCSPTECCDGVQCTDVNCPDQCEILGQPVRAEVRNPANDCQICTPEVNRFDWTLVDDNITCGGVSGRVCCNGECCSPTECCGATSCEECGPHCHIGDDDIDAGDVNPANDCEVCKPEVRFTDWSPADDDADCGVGQFCCAGDCCPLGQCCNEGTCGECGCLIGDDDFDRDDVNPDEKCEICNPDADREDWSPGPPNAACGLFNERFCCAGDCCAGDECCNAIGECVTCGCVILGEPVLEDVANPLKTCQVCQPNQDRRDWTVLDDDEACGTDTDDRVCCSGECCPQGQCCVEGACQPCGCEIEGEDDPVAPNSVNEDNICQICDPSRDRFDWSPVLGDKPCGANGEQDCCNGECCLEDQCCLLDACGECLCAIEGVGNVPPDTANEDNACQVCKPDVDPFDWTVLADDEACVDLPDQVCCGGKCCELGQCCTDGACGDCACTIDGKGVKEGTVNPANPCEVCDSSESAEAWTPVDDDTACGEHQVCCAGTCCGVGHCCVGGTCLACRCVIDGVPHEPGVPNPANGCEVCDPLESTTAWSSAIDESACADQPGECCAGICCPLGECCHAREGTCGPAPCRCLIEGQEHLEGGVNPENACEECDPHKTGSDWTAKQDDSSCGEGDRVCCTGVCCPAGECCSAAGECESCGCEIDGQSFAEGDLNPDNECEVCDPAVSTTDWSPPSEPTNCALNEGQCCGRECCFAQCCVDVCCASSAVCGECGGDSCEIEGATVPEGTVNPVNSCEECNPFFSTITWTARRDDELCGPDGTQFCCNGVCCVPFACCNDDDVCQIGGNFHCEERCEIGGQFFPHSFVNPANPCQECDTFNSLTDWSPRLNIFQCGVDLQQTCCNGVCCPPGVCCSSSFSGGLCVPCP